MKKITFGLSIWTALLMFCALTSSAQVGIGTATPDASSILDVSSTSQGFLTPRMTTTERNAIASPADGLIVYDLTLKSFYHYNTSTSSWAIIISEVNGRLNFKRIKSTDVLATVLATEKAAGGNTKYVLNANTYYEINGTILVDLPIDLNNAYVVGLDANEDVLFRSGSLFVGATGGTIKNVTISVPSGNVFTLSGANTENFIVRDCIIANSSNVGSISGFGLVFFAIVQYSGNTTGITYDNITRLLLSNTAWFGNNTGTFEKFTGSFSVIQKQGGFCEVYGTSVGIDVSSNPTISIDAVVETVVFTGTLSTGLYVKGYTTGSYSGFNFNNKWNVRCSGIPQETDMVSVGDINLELAVGSGTQTTLTTGTPVKISGTTTSNIFFRTSTGGLSNRLQYLGSKKRFISVSATGSFQATDNSNTIYVFYVAKNGVVISRSKTYIFTTNITDIFAFPLQCEVELAPNDYVEVFAERLSGSSNILTVSLSLFMR